MSYLQKAKDLYAMVGQGQIMDAFEKFYHTDVVMQEIGEEPRVGKDDWNGDHIIKEVFYHK